MLAPLEDKLNGVKWGEYKVPDIFEVRNTHNILSTEVLADSGETPYLCASSDNNAVSSFIDYKKDLIEEGNCIFIGGKTFVVTYQERDFFSNDSHNLALYLKDSNNRTKSSQLFISACIYKSLSHKYSWGNSISFKKIQEDVISLPQTETGEINFAFMALCMRELEESRLRELKTYLIASGLNDYHLTTIDQASLDTFAKTRWRSFNIQELFGKSTRGKRLKGEDRTPGSLPFVTAGEANTGISAFIGNQVEVFMSNTTTIDMFGSAKYRNYDYGADDHVAVVHTESLPKNAAIFVAASCHKAAHTGKFDYGHNFYAKDADELNIMLPVCADGHPDFDEMEHLIAAIHKMVITDVAEFTSRELSATRQVVEDNRPETVIKKRCIHRSYKSGRIPLYSLRAACGRFEGNEIPEVNGWVDASGLGFSPNKDKHFVVYAKGDSMMPKIHDGDLCVFEWYKGGSREGEIVLTQSSDYDSDYDGKYTIKRYHSEKQASEDSWQHTKIQLFPLNPEYDPIVLTTEDEDEYRTVGVLKRIITA